ncbi:response regulator [Salipiger thiooxidans]|uniref:response regulator n=1 Tax=Salipiger thiooxidans TaxID=282683 RepID=UPI001CD55A1B|nr:response regulator transcription factor [Salipiger thiooxidans]MCA0849807.1 response regulator transcription factor [Salipiger thiooxidans]
MRILIAEDNPTLSEGLKGVLYAAGYSTDTVADGLDAEALLLAQTYDLLLLDLGLPGLDGIDLLTSLRRNGRQIPVMVISARDRVEERIAGLETGADDYLCKPFAMDEALARVRALIRRRNLQPTHRLAHGQIILDQIARAVTLDGRPVALHRRELVILEFLMLNSGRVVSKAQIAERVAGFEDDLNPQAVETYISRLRSKLSPALDLKTIRGLGYLLSNDS